MTLENVYTATNGDIFLEYDMASEFTEQPPEIVAAVIAKARRILDNGEATPAIAKRNGGHDMIPIHLSYYDLDGEIIATAGIHVLDTYSKSSRFFFLRRLSEETDGEEIQRAFSEHDGMTFDEFKQLFKED